MNKKFQTTTWKLDLPSIWCFSSEEVASEENDDYWQDKAASIEWLKVIWDELGQARYFLMGQGKTWLYFRKRCVVTEKQAWPQNQLLPLLSAFVPKRFKTSTHILLPLLHWFWCSLEYNYSLLFDGQITIIRIYHFAYSYDIVSITNSFHLYFIYHHILWFLLKLAK